MKKNIVHLDFETFSEVSVKKVGAYRYSTHPSTIVLCMQYAINDLSPILWLPKSEYEMWDEPPKARTCKPFKNYKNFVFAAHNCQFEYLIWLNVCCRLYGWPEPPPLEQWIDTAAIARYYGLPGKLEDASKALHLPHQKDMAGHRVMLKLSRPRKASAANKDIRWTPATKPEDFKILYKYCERDVYPERGIYSKLGPLPPIEQRIWILNEKINARGIACDVDLARRILLLKEHHVDFVNSRIRELTNDEVDRATQTKKLTDYLGVDSLAKENLLNRNRDDYTEEQNELMDLRLSASQSSTAKFEAMLNCVCDDGRLRGMFIYHTANQTARFGGALIQPHNLPRPDLSNAEIHLVIEMIMRAPNVRECYEILMNYDDDPLRAMKSLIRAALLAEENRTLVVSDFSSVEPRMLAWLSNCKRLLNIYRRDGSPYIDMAEALFKMKVDKEKNFYEYFVGKQTILGAGYGMSGGRFQSECDSRGIDISESFAEEAIKSYRERYHEIPRLWREVNRLAIKAVQVGGRQFVGRCAIEVRGLPFHRLVITLPSGREMSYPYPSVRMVWPPWDSDEKIPQLHYWTVDQRTYSWKNTSTYGGKLVENMTQGACRDVLCSRMLRLDKKDFPLILHVHDECGGEVKEENKDRAQQFMDKVMSTTPPWAGGLVLKGEGYVADRYRKG